MASSTQKVIISYMHLVSYREMIHCVQSSTATVVWFHFRLARKDVRTREVGTFFENFVI
jgi:hypothetical protein